VIERIDDAGDPRAADYAHVGDPDWLRRHALFVAEGRLVVERLIAAGRFAPRSILVTPAALAKLTPSLARVRCPVYVAAPPILETITGFDFHRGCLAIASREPAVGFEGPTGSEYRLLGLEGVGNPDNVGGLFRVAAAFGSEGILLDPGSADPLYRKAIRTSMGAALRIPFFRPMPWPDSLETLRAQGFKIVALTPRHPAVPLADYARLVEGDERLVLMVGAEGEGLSDAVLRLADAAVRIPVAAGVDSLNVVVAAGIALAMLSHPGANA
jgi:tRNA G18 (ribose-2'-O)-methylase SpoU